MGAKITVFTATYNRADTIERLYRSLQKQSINTFEWIIVDDGSNDNTKDIISKIQKNENAFLIEYLYQTNGGKHRAINKGLERATGELFFIVDSDDYLTETSLERILYWRNTITNNKDYAGVAGLKGHSQDKMVGSTFKQLNYLDATSLERDFYGIIGDKAEVFFTAVLRNYKFPEFKDEKFISEAVVWNKIAYEGFKIRWFNEIVYIVEEYRPDGLTSMGMEKFLDNWEGYSLYVNQELKYRKRLIRKINLIFVYAKMSKLKGQDVIISSQKTGCNLWLMKTAYFLENLYFRLRKLVFYEK